MYTTCTLNYEDKAPNVLDYVRYLVHVVHCNIPVKPLHRLTREHYS